MIVTFEDTYLRELFEHGICSDKKHRFQPQIVKLYRRRVEQLLNFLITMTDMNVIAGIEPDMIANNLTPLEPTHPGEILREEIESRGITQTKLANEIGVNVSLLNELINGKRDFTIEYALMLEAALGIDSDFWINLQTAYSKAKAKHDKSFMERLAAIRRIAAVL